MTNEEKPSADLRKKHRLPLLTRNTLWYVVIFGSPVIVGFLASLLVPVCMRSRTGSRIAETRSIIAAVAQSVDAYRQEFGELPSLVNRNLVKELAGQNGKQTPFLDLRRGNLNPQGEVVDAWGTPLRILRQADDSVQIMSAGQDKVFGTTDDIKWLNGR